MTIRTHCTIDPRHYPTHLGAPGQGLYFIEQALRPVLESTHFPSVCLGDEGQAPTLFFSLPHALPESLPPASYVVFSWPFDQLPMACESAPWSAWARGLAACNGAVTFSQQAAAAIRQAMGDDYPVLVSPAQVAERFAHLCPADGFLPSSQPRRLSFFGLLLDSPRIGLSVDGLATAESETPAPAPAPISVATPQLGLWARLGLTRQLMQGWWQEAVAPYLDLRHAPLQPESMPETADRVVDDLPVGHWQQVKLHGVVYTCVLRAEDENCRWIELLSAFCWTFRNQANVTLVLKFTHHNLSSGRIALLTELSRLSPFKCRVVAINAFLDDSQYVELIGASHFLVHPASCEGSALTVQEFLSAGRPVIAASHSALADWLNDRNSILVSADLQPAHWPGDPDKQQHHFSQRLNWASLCGALERSYSLVEESPKAYQAMSRAARDEVMQRASQDVLRASYAGFFKRSCGDAATPKPCMEAP